MLPVVANKRFTLTRLLEQKGDLTLSTYDAVQPISLAKMGVLYMVAALIQTSWPYLVLTNWDTAVRWSGMPVIGWALVAIWISSAYCVVHLFFLGLRMVMLSRNPDVIITQTPRDKKKMGMIAFLLLLGILADIVVVPFIIDLPDKSLVLFLAGAMGGRVLQANLEAILQYHNS